MKPNKATKKQHIVPCGFLAKFSKKPDLKRKALIWAYNKHKHTYREASVESVFYENDIYTVKLGGIDPEILEETFAKIEAKSMPYLNRFIQRGQFLYDNLQPDEPLETENAFIQEFIISLLLRQPKYVKRAILLEKERFNDIVNGVLYAVNFEKNLRKNVAHISRNYDLLSFKAESGNFILNDNYATKIAFEKLKASFPVPQVLVDKAAKEGCSPSQLAMLNEIWNDLIDLSIEQKSQTYGAALIFCPIAPQLSIGFAHKTLDQNHKENYGKPSFMMSPREYSEKGVKLINIKTLQQARNFIYGEDKETLEEIVALAAAAAET